LDKLQLYLKFGHVLTFSRKDMTLTVLERTPSHWHACTF
jgi:hypothetical protein